MAKGEFCGCHGDGSVVLKRDGLFGRKVKVVNMNLYLSTGGFTIYTSLTPYNPTSNSSGKPLCNLSTAAAAYY